MGSSSTPAARVAALVFGALARRRRARALHPDGAAFEAVVDVPGGAGTGAALLDLPGRHAALVRFSRAAGTPRPWPDGLGVGLRILDARGPGRHQDLLFTTSVDLPLAHHLVLPTVGGFFGQSSTTAFAYRVGGRRAVLGVRPARRRRGADLPELRRAVAAGDAGFELCLARPLGRWRTVASIVPGAPLGEAAEAALSLDLGNSGAGIEPTRLLLAARRAAYRSSQARRPGAALPDSAA